MSAQRGRTTRWALLLVAGAPLLSGATWPNARRPVTQAISSRAPGALSPWEPADPAPTSALSEPSRAALLRIPAGDYLPFYKSKNESETKRPVPAFQVATQPVTRRDFLRFVRDNPRWRRSRAQRLFAEASYLADWSGDLDPGGAALSSALGGVSWFAARAYCASVGLRLPTTIEWERALSVVGQSFAPRAEPGSNLSASLWEWTADFNALPLATGDTGDSVASLFCGAGALATDATDYGAFLRYSFRSSLKADYALKNLGFRCAESAP